MLMVFVRLVECMDYVACKLCMYVISWTCAYRRLYNKEVGSYGGSSVVRTVVLLIRLIIVGVVRDQ